MSTVHVANEEEPDLVTTRQVVRACMRCRKQKSKCDAFRPCSVCVKAGVSCISRNPEERSKTQKQTERPAKIRKTVAAPKPDHVDLDTIHVKEASMDARLFALTPGHLMEDSTATPPSLSTSPSSNTYIDPQHRGVLPWSHSRPSAASLLAQLPPRAVTDYLVAVYFNTVHWFMVVVHEGHFLRHYRRLMDQYAQDPCQVGNSDDDFTFAYLMLLVVVLGGRYTSTHAARMRRCREIAAQDDFDLLRSTAHLFSVIRSCHSDNLACGRLATVQSSLLLGSLFLYHGEANLAWANSGSTIRMAQTLGIHRTGSEIHWPSLSSSYYACMPLEERRQLRYRLFWAVHTSDRFLAMCYGLPILMSDKDCSADIPSEYNIYPPSGTPSYLLLDDKSPESEGKPKVTLLTYQTHKGYIYILLGQIISTLHRPADGGGCNAVLARFGADDDETGTRHRDDDTSANVLHQVQSLERKLNKWYSNLPDELRLASDMTYPPYSELFQPPQEVGFNSSHDDDDEIIFPDPQDDPFERSHNLTPSQSRHRRERVKRGIFGIQALLLQVAYDNALILIHRPILALKSSPASSSPVLPLTILARSVDVCWHAALRISRIGEHHVFQSTQQAHAVSYVGIHLFAAGVVLSVFGASNPLGSRSLEAKQGLRRIIQMQRRLRRKVIVAGQGLALLENLAREMMRKEMEVLLGEDKEDEEAYVPGDKEQEPEQPLPAQELQPLQEPLVHLERASLPDWIHSGDGLSTPTRDDLFGNFLMNDSMLDIERLLTDSSLLSSDVPPTRAWWLA